VTKRGGRGDRARHATTRYIGVLAYHPSGYGVCGKEDLASHMTVFRNLKNEVEGVVAQRIEDQQSI